MPNETVSSDPQALPAVEKIRYAEQLVRKEHRILSEDWAFWHEVADFLNASACIPEKTGNRTSDWSLFNRAQDMANGYIRMSERLKKESEGR